MREAGNSTRTLLSQAKDSVVEILQIIIISSWDVVVVLVRIKWSNQYIIHGTYPMTSPRLVHPLL